MSEFSITRFETYRSLEGAVKCKPRCMASSSSSNGLLQAALHEIVYSIVSHQEGGEVRAICCVIIDRGREDEQETVVCVRLCASINDPSVFLQLRCGLGWSRRWCAALVVLSHVCRAVNAALSVSYVLR